MNPTWRGISGTDVGLGLLMLEHPLLLASSLRCEMAPRSLILLDVFFQMVVFINNSRAPLKRHQVNSEHFLLLWVGSYIMDVL